MHQALKSFATMTVAAAAMLAAKSAHATSTHGVVFIHGTGDYPGQMTCSSGNCVVNSALTGYWTQGEITSVANGRPYAIVGYAGGTCAPWASGSTTGLASGSVSDPNYESGCTTSTNNTTGLNLQGGSAASNADVIAAQIQMFITNSGINELVLVTHSGGSNQARYILENYTRNSNYSNIKSITKRVVTIAATTDGTYLANEVFSGGVTNFLGGLLGYNGEGTNFIRTNYMSTYNAAGSYFDGSKNPVQGINIYSTGGTSGSTCYGVKVFGVCVGITGQTLGGSSCDSLLDDVALLALHDLYMDTSDSSTFRNSCSDGFISCMGSQALGNDFGYAEKQDHNQSRRQCNGLDVEIRNTVAGAAKGFEYNALTTAEASPLQLDSCAFSTSAWGGGYCAKNSDCSAIGVGGTCVSGQCTGIIGGGSGYSCTTDSWCQSNVDADSACLGGVCRYFANEHNGCAANWLGDGYCDWDCVAVYGNDAVPTWGGSNTSCTSNSQCTVSGETCYTSIGKCTTGKVTAWASTGDCSSTSNGSDEGVYAWTSSPFNGKTATNAGSSSVWFTDPFAGTSEAINQCPQSWVNDGICDECAIVDYGNDGTDCVTSKAMQCSMLSSYLPNYEYKNNPIANGAFLVNGKVTDSYYTNVSYDSSTGYSQVPVEVVGLSGTNNDGICEMGECTTSATWPGTGQCVSNTDCASGVCVNGGCQVSTAIGNDCTATYTMPANPCTENSNCTGDYCVGGACTMSLVSCSADSSCPGYIDDFCSGGVCVLSGSPSSCTANTQCSQWNASAAAASSCSSGACTGTGGSVTQSLCR